MTKITSVSTIMRVVLGVIFLAHGITKLQMGLGNVEAWFSSIAVPGFLGYIVAVIEVVGGILLIAGLLTRLVSGLNVILMVGAIVSVKLSAGLLGNDQMPGYELEIALMLLSLYLVVAEASPLSIDRVIRSKRNASVQN